MAIKQPADKSYFILPDLGEGVHEAELIKWKVAVGDQVQEHQTIAEMETDKALVEVPSPWTGVISELHGEEGEILNVGNKLVSYATSGATAEPAAVAAGADGLMIEVHNNPAKAKCDGAQSLTPDQFDELMGFITKEVEFFGKKMN